MKPKSMKIDQKRHKIHENDAKMGKKGIKSLKISQKTPKNSENKAFKIRHLPMKINKSALNRHP